MNGKSRAWHRNYCSMHVFSQLTQPVCGQNSRSRQEQLISLCRLKSKGVNSTRRTCQSFPFNGHTVHIVVRSRSMSNPNGLIRLVRPWTELQQGLNGKANWSSPPQHLTVLKDFIFCLPKEILYFQLSNSKTTDNNGDLVI